MSIALFLDLSAELTTYAPEPVEPALFLVPAFKPAPKEIFILRDEHGAIVESKTFHELVDANQAARKLLRKIGVYRKSDNVAMSFQGPMGWNGPGRRATTLGNNYSIRPKKKVVK